MLLEHGCGNQLMQPLDLFKGLHATKLPGKGEWHDE